MKIALLTDGVSPFVMGGMQRHSALLAQHLVSAGVDVDLYHTAQGTEAIQSAKCLGGFPEDVGETIGNVFVEYPVRGKLPGHYLRDSAEYSRRLLQQFQKHDRGSSDFIYAQGQTGRAFIESKRSGIKLPPIGINAHGYEMFQWAGGLRTHLEHIMLRPAFRRLSLKADYVFSFSGKVREIIEEQIGVPEQKIIQLPNAVDGDWVVNCSKPAGDKRLRFVFIGRDERRKGVPDILQAINFLTDEGFEFHFVGPIPISSRIESASVFYHGKINDNAELQGILDRCDVLVCPSYAEGMPTVILEAMARGLAIIATDVGAVTELVGTDNGVLMAEAGVAPLKEAMNILLKMDSDSLQKMKQSSLNKVANYTWDRVAQLTIAEIEEKLSKR